jgi:peptide chain release factor 2
VAKRLGGIFDYEQKKERLEEVMRELEDPTVWNNPEQAQALGKERSALENSVGVLDKLTELVADAADVRFSR